VDDYDFNTKKTAPSRRASARRNVLPEVCLAITPEKDSGWVRPFQNRFTKPAAPLATRMRIWAKKNKTHPATARDLRFVGPAPAGNQSAPQLTKTAHHQSPASVPSKTQNSI